MQLPSAHQSLCCLLVAKIVNAKMCNQRDCQYFYIPAQITPRFREIKYSKKLIFKKVHPFICLLKLRGLEQVPKYIRIKKTTIIVMFLFAFLQI